MWHTSRGDRTLVGHEAALVSHAVETMVGALFVHIDEEFEDSAVDCDSGIAIYDLCTPSQRIGLLHDVAKHLLTETNEPLLLSALTEATVAAIFVEIRDQIAIEIEFATGPDSDGEPNWRELAMAAHRSVFAEAREQGLESSTAGIGVSSDDLHSWEVMVDDLADSILWDRDFEMADEFLDVDPGVSQQRRRLLGIEDEYFTQVAPDPLLDEVFRLVSRTKDIVRSKPR